MTCLRLSSSCPMNVSQQMLRGIQHYSDMSVPVASQLAPGWLSFSSLANSTSKTFTCKAKLLILNSQRYRKFPSLQAAPLVTAHPSALLLNPSLTNQHNTSNRHTHSPLRACGPLYTSLQGQKAGAFFNDCRRHRQPNRPQYHF